MRKHHVSILHALEGVFHAINTQPNFLIHLFLSSLAIIGGVIFQISLEEWVTICLLIVLGLAIELVNTAIESVVDLITLEWRKEAKIAKDTSAAAMLVFSIGAALIAVLIFVPKIVALF
jgi:diacylglycerol kinase (ATP)